MTIEVSTSVWFNDWEECYTFFGPDVQTRVVGLSWPSNLCDSSTEKDVIHCRPRFQTPVVDFLDHPSLNLYVIQLLKGKFDVLLSAVSNLCCSSFLTIQVSTSVWLNDWEEGYTVCCLHLQTRVVALSWPSKFQPLCDSMTEKKAMLYVVQTSKLML